MSSKILNNQPDIEGSHRKAYPSVPQIYSSAREFLKSVDDSSGDYAVSHDEESSGPARVLRTEPSHSKSKGSKNAMKQPNRSRSKSSEVNKIDIIDALNCPSRERSRTELQSVPVSQSPSFVLESEKSKHDVFFNSFPGHPDLSHDSSSLSRNSFSLSASSQESRLSSFNLSSFEKSNSLENVEELTPIKREGPSQKLFGAPIHRLNTFPLEKLDHANTEKAGELNKLNPHIQASKPSLKSVAPLPTNSQPSKQINNSRIHHNRGHVVVPMDNPDLSVSGTSLEQYIHTAFPRVQDESVNILIPSSNILSNDMLVASNYGNAKKGNRRKHLKEMKKNQKLQYIEESNLALLQHQANIMSTPPRNEKLLDTHQMTPSTNGNGIIAEPESNSKNKTPKTTTISSVQKSKTTASSFKTPEKQRAIEQEPAQPREVNNLENKISSNDKILNERLLQAKAMNRQNESNGAIMHQFSLWSKMVPTKVVPPGEMNEKTDTDDDKVAPAKRPSRLRELRANPIIQDEALDYDQVLSPLSFAGKVVEIEKTTGAHTNANLSQIANDAEIFKGSRALAIREMVGSCKQTSTGSVAETIQTELENEYTESLLEPLSESDISEDVSFVVENSPKEESYENFGNYNIHGVARISPEEILPPISPSLNIVSSAKEKSSNKENLDFVSTPPPHRQNGNESPLSEVSEVDEEESNERLPPSKSNAFKYSTPPSASRGASSESMNKASTISISWKISGEVIGEGTFGKVYKGMNEATGELLAVKQICLADGTQAEVENLRKEIQVMEHLNHPNIVRYIGTSVTERYLQIILEYVPGGSVAGMLQQFGPCSDSLIKRLLFQMLTGVEYLHSKGIVHRDIKGANVLVTDGGVAKLADFGCSKQLAGMCTLSLEDSMRTIRGSVPWMAPEVIKQSGHGRSADIWSIGATVIEMATGKHPWPEFSNNMAALFHVATSKEPPPAPENLNESATLLLKRCLVIDPRSRASATELLNDKYFK